MSNKKCVKLILTSILIIILLMCNKVYAVNAGYELGKAIFKLFSYTGIFILVIVIAIYVTRFIAKNSKKFINSKYMKIIDILNIDINTKIAMIEINKKIYVFAINNNNVEMIDKLDRKSTRLNSSHV